MKPVSLEQLTPEQRASLMDDLKKQEAAKEQLTREERQAYKTLVNDTIPLLFNVLKETSKALSDAKTYVYDNLESLIKLKGDLYGRQSDQFSHSFTTENGITIIVGYRHTDGWDDTVTAGIAKVQEYIQSLGRDDNSKALVKTVMQLLAKDTAGNLKASRVLQLKKLADETGNSGFKDAIQIIQDAYRPNKSRQFVTCRYRDEAGSWHELPLAITDVDFNKQAKQ